MDDDIEFCLQCFQCISRERAPPAVRLHLSPGPVCISNAIVMIVTLKKDFSVKKL